MATQPVEQLLSFDPATLPCERAVLAADRPMPLDCGAELGPFTLAYMSYGTLNADRSNAILICHALTMDQYVASPNPVTGKPGWWSNMVGPGKPIDTNKYYVLCANVIGGCIGSTGPLDINPTTGKAWGLDFPVLTIADMVRAQVLLLDHLGIDKLYSVIGGSMGGMQVLQFAVDYPDRTVSAIPIATASRHTTQNIAFHEVGRQAIMVDPDWSDGAYHLEGRRPRRGLAVARMAAHITYLSEVALHQKFGRSLQDRSSLSYGFGADFQVESYLRHQGSTFVDRFDANSYFYITRAMDYFDLAAEHDGQLVEAFRDTPVRFALISFTSDWLFPTSESRALVHALNGAAANVSFVEIESDKGHDAFLLDEPEMLRVIEGFLDGLGEVHQDDAPVASPLAPTDVRVDLKLIADMIEPKSRVLDVGCGDGTLLAYLGRERQVDGRGVELMPERVQSALSRGVSVVQGDADQDLADYPSNGFDYVILSQTLQAMNDPRAVVEQMIRIGRHAIVSFQNYGHWKVRLSLLFSGSRPRLGNGAGFEWWENPNIHNCTITDFVELCRTIGVRVERAVILNSRGEETPFGWNGRGNLFGEQAVFLLSRRDA